MLKICPLMASTRFFLMWPKSKVVQVDREKLTVAKFSRARIARALCKCIFMYEPGSEARGQGRPGKEETPEERGRKTRRPPQIPKTEAWQEGA